MTHPHAFFIDLYDFPTSTYIKWLAADQQKTDKNILITTT